MRDNSGKGEGTNNLLDPTLKEHERDRGRSGEAPLEVKDKTGHNRTSSPDNRGGGAR